MRLALFDLDDTLLDGDCSDRWNLWMIEQGWVSDAEGFMARAEAMQQAYQAGKLKLEEYLAMTLAPLRGRRVDDVQKEVERFVATHLQPRIFEQAWRCLDAHRQAGDTLVLISASAFSRASLLSLVAAIRCSSSAISFWPSSPSPSSF